MGSTGNPQESLNCPNCGVECNVEETHANHEDALVDCHNLNCSVDRFWGMPGEDFFED